MSIVDVKNQYPVRIVAAVQATIALLPMFGVPLSPVQMGAITLAFSAWMAVITHGQVSPTKG